MAEINNGGNAPVEMDINNALIMTQWSRMTWEFAMNYTNLSPLMSRSLGQGAIYMSDLLKDQGGDSIRIPMRQPFENFGFEGDADVLGNEEKVSYLNEAVSINKKMFASTSPTTFSMQQQRVPMKLATDAAQELARQCGHFLPAVVLRVLGGYGLRTPQYNGWKYYDNPIPDSAINSFNGFNTITAPDRIYYPNGKTSEDEITASDILQLTDIDELKVMAQMPPDGKKIIEPMGDSGKYVLMVSPQQAALFRALTGAGSWQDTVKYLSAMTVKNNEMFKGFNADNSLVTEYNDVRIMTSTFLPFGIQKDGATANTSVQRAVFLGADAGCFAGGAISGEQRGGDDSDLFEVTVYDRPHKGGRSFAAHLMFGFKKLNFKKQDGTSYGDNGSIVVPTAAGRNQFNKSTANVAAFKQFAEDQQTRQRQVLASGTAGQAGNAERDNAAVDAGIANSPASRGNNK